MPEMLTTEKFIENVKRCTNEEDARLAISGAYPTSFGTSDSFYHSSGIADLGWDAFYAVRDVEEKFHLGCCVSAYIATCLAYPRIGKLYSEMANNCTSSKEDFCSKVFELLMTDIIPKWDKTINNNFWAYLQPNLLTVRNEIRNEDRGISDYIVKTRGLSVTSMEYLKEKSENSSWELPDYEQDVEEKVLYNIEQERKQLLKRVIGLKNDDNNATATNIWNSIICQKLFHDANEKEMAILSDDRISTMLEKYYDWMDEKKKSLDGEGLALA